MCIKLIINSSGLVLDLIGVVLLFLWTAIGYQKIKPLHQNLGSSVSIVARTVEALISDLNKMIEKINAENEKRIKKSRIAILLIILGFVLQLVSVWL